mgnify:CR=1 FL=1
MIGVDGSAAVGRPLPPAILLMGPTASGKTDLAIALRDRLPVELISVDSAMVYRGMDIGTAKPTADELARTPHRLVDICDPAEAYSAARFRADALQAMDAARAAGRIPLLVGGTMLYYRALQYGLSRLPASDPAVRAELEQQMQAQGLGSLHAELARDTAAFVAALALRAYEREHEYHRVLHEFVDQIERLLTLAVLLVLGYAAADGLLSALTPGSVVVAVALVLVIRPLGGWMSLAGCRRDPGQQHGSPPGTPDRAPHVATKGTPP